MAGEGPVAGSSREPAGSREEYVEAVLDAVEQIPPGQVATYGDIAEVVGRGGPRQVGQVMARHGAPVPWWRVVRSDGRPARGLENEALTRLLAESAPIRNDRVDLRHARYAFGVADLRSKASQGSQLR
ncbi:MAG TPA: MGMT family protein [Dermatophilaceae bacterium]|nr:MGMT family protein [Dermatophilaceae bacterium]